MEAAKNLALISMLLGISALFFYPGIIIIEVLCRIERFPLNFTIIGNAAIICSILGLGIGVMSKNELNYIRGSAVAYKIMAVIGIVCSVIMMVHMSIIIVFVILDDLEIYKLSFM